MSLLVHKKTSLWPRIRHCLKQGLNYFNNTRACFYFDLTVCVLFLSLLWFDLQLLSLLFLVIRDQFLSMLLLFLKSNPLPHSLQSLNYNQLNVWLNQAKLTYYRTVSSDLWIWLVDFHCRFSLSVSLHLSVFTVFQAVRLCVAWQLITFDHALGSFETIFKEQT